MSGDGKNQPQIDEVESEKLAQAHRDQDTRELMEELEAEGEQQVLLDAAEMAEQAEKRQVEAEREQAKLDEANLELMKQEGFEKASAELEKKILDREAQREAQKAQEAAASERDSAELEEAHLRQEGAIDEAIERAGEVAGDQSSVASERAGTTPTNVVQNVVIGVIAIATLIAGAALMRNRGRTPPSAPASTSTSTKPPVSLEGALRASIEVEYIHKYDWLDHRIKYSSTTEIGSEIGGTGKGEYRERGDSTPEGEEPCSVIRSGRVTMRVEITPDLRELAAKIQGPVERKVTGRPDCSANVDQRNSADIVCVFKDVDLVRGGRYRAEDHPPEIWDGNINQETCTMDLTPFGK